MVLRVAGITKSIVHQRLDLFTDPNGIAGNFNLGHIYVTNSKGSTPVVKISVQGGVEGLVKKGKRLFTSPQAIAVNHRTGLVYVVNRLEAIPFYHPGIVLYTLQYSICSLCS